MRCFDPTLPRYGTDLLAAAAFACGSLLNLGKHLLKCRERGERFQIFFLADPIHLIIIKLNRSSEGGHRLPGPMESRQGAGALVVRLAILLVHGYRLIRSL